MIYESHSERDTFEFGQRLGRRSAAGEIYLLHGDLGVGKTVFAKGFAEGLGISEPITSPTFTLIQEYESGRLPFYHFDAYRIEDEDEMYELGFEGYLFGEGVCLIEWASRISNILPDDCKNITIEKDLEQGFDYRKIVFGA